MYKCLLNLFLTLQPCTAHSGMVQVFRSSRSLVPLADLIQSLPDSVQPAVLGTPLRKKDYDKLLNTINCITLQEALNWG